MPIGLALEACFEAFLVQDLDDGLGCGSEATSASFVTFHSSIKTIWNRREL